MIIANTPCFYLVRASGEAAESVTSRFSPATASDIETVVLLSTDFDSDIEATQSMDQVLEKVACGMPHFTILEAQEKYNPLYTSNSMGDIDEMLNLDPRTDGYKFTGMDGNPFVFKQVKMFDNEEPVIEAKVQYHSFDLPGYSDITAQQDAPLN